MKRVAIIFMVLLACLIHPIITNAQKVKDAFVLVDVSGSMKHSHINQEAKQIISSMLQGNLLLSNYPGWSRVTTKGLDGNCPLLSGNKSSFLSNGGSVCILPFGNVERVRDYKFVDLSNFASSFDSSFPTTFKDRWTYITLAKSYAVNVASKNGISGMVYMIIYSDGAEESMDGRIGYPEEFRTIVDYFGTRNDSFCQKNGVVRKYYNNKNFDIEIWTMGPIPPSVCSKCGQNPCVCGTPPTRPPEITITNQPQGKSPKVPIEVDVKEPVTLKWKNVCGKVNINVQRKVGESYTNIPKNDQDNHYTLEKKANSVTIIFYKAQDYKVIVADSNGRDYRCFKVKSDILTDVLPFLISAILIIGGICLWRTIKPPPTKKFVPGFGDSDGNPINRSNDDDWK